MRFSIASVVALFFVTAALSATAAAAGPPGTSRDYVVAEVPSVEMGVGVGVDASQVLHDFVDYITNGDPDWVVSGLTIGGGGGASGEPEETLFDGAAGPSGVDLAGYAIDRVGFRVDAISINGDDSYTEASLSGTYVFEGHIANPGACARGGWQKLRAADGSGFPDLLACVRCVARGG